MAAFLLLLCALVAVAAGVAHAMLKNSQLQTLREIDKVQGRIGDLEMDIKTEIMRSSTLLDRYEMRSALERIDSQLAPISNAQLEVIRPGDLESEVAQNLIP